MIHETHAHDHPHPHDHPHEHEHTGRWGWLRSLFHGPGHSHDHTDLAADQAFLDNQAGIRTVWVALAVLTLTAVLQLFIVYLSRSVALLADTAHNIGDGLNSIPLLIAFYLARRLPTRRYTYGFARAEDVAGIFIVLSIVVSAAIVFGESWQRFLDPQPLTNVGWVAAAALIGFLGNEIVAVMQIRVGRRIGSAALVADGLHARTDGLTSLAVLLAAGGSWLGFPILDPLIGLAIGVTILFITWDATKTMWYRLMDAVDPDLTAVAEAAIKQHPDVQAIHYLRLRWLGHQLHAEAKLAVDPQMTAAEGQTLIQHMRHDLGHQLPKLSQMVVELDASEIRGVGGGETERE